MPLLLHRLGFANILSRNSSITPLSTFTGWDLDSSLMGSSTGGSRILCWLGDTGRYSSLCNLAFLNSGHVTCKWTIAAVIGWVFGVFRVCFCYSLRKVTRKGSIV